MVFVGGAGKAWMRLAVFCGLTSGDIGREMLLFAGGQKG